MEKYEIAEQDYIKGMKYKQIAEKYNVTINTVKSWKTRYGWTRGGNSRERKKCVHTKNEESVHTKNEVDDDVGELSERERLFAIYYLKSFNAVKSYMKVYECSYESAAVSAHRMLKKPKIKSYLESLMQEREENIGIREADVLQKYADIAMADMNDFMQQDGAGWYSPKPSIDGTIVQEIKQGKFGVSIKLNDRMKALDKLQQYFEDRRKAELVKTEKEKQKEEENAYTGEIYLMPVMDDPQEEGNEE